MPLQQSKQIIEDVLDGDGAVAGQLHLFPADQRVQEAYLTVANIMLGKGNEIKKSGVWDEKHWANKEAIKGELDTEKDFQIAADVFGKEMKGLRSMVEMADEVRPYLDILFGADGERLILGGGHNTMFLMEVMYWAADFFDEIGEEYKRRQAAMDKYRGNRDARRHAK